MALSPEQIKRLNRAHSNIDYTKLTPEQKQALANLATINGPMGLMINALSELSQTGDFTFPEPPSKSPDIGKIIGPIPPPDPSPKE